jgi:hypothetical protein
MTRFRNQYRIESARHPRHDYASDGWYRVVICTHCQPCHFGEIRKGIMGLSEVGIEAHHCCASIPYRFDHVRFDSFVVMPSHLHPIIGITSASAHANHRHASVTFGPLRPASLSAIVGPTKQWSGVVFGAKGSLNSAGSPDFRKVLSALIGNYRRRGIYIDENPANWYLDPQNPDHH